MNVDDIKALVERLKSKRKMHLANASDIECLNALETLAMENQRLRTDAERYRWLKSMSRCEMFELSLELDWYAPTEDLDADIDAARAKMVKEKP
jgi:hypothetical protein